MKKTLFLCAMLGMSLNATSFARGAWGSHHSGRWDSITSHDDKNHGGYVDARVTDYCWVQDENGRVLDATYFGAWRNIPRAQKNAIDSCKSSRDESYCQANVKCEANDPWHKGL